MCIKIMTIQVIIIRDYKNDCDYMKKIITIFKNLGRYGGPIAHSVPGTHFNFVQAQEIVRDMAM